MVEKDFLISVQDGLGLSLAKWQRTPFLGLFSVASYQPPASLAVHISPPAKLCYCFGFNGSIGGQGGWREKQYYEIAVFYFSI